MRECVSGGVVFEDAEAEGKKLRMRNKGIYVREIMCR